MADDISMSRDAVLWAYRLFLDRNPESDSSVNDKLRRLTCIRDLRKEFMASPEFLAKGEVVPTRQFNGLEPPMSISETSSPAELEKLHAHIQSVWESLGQSEPHWSVLSSDAFLQENLKGNEEAFFQSGNDAVKRFLATLERNGVMADKHSTVLEYGCGLGRVTRWLAQRFASVYAYDISLSHLQAARRYLDQQKCDNVTLGHIQSPRDIARLHSADLVFTLIVLQHNPPPVIEKIVEALVFSLNEGGVAYFQVPTYRRGYSFSVDEYLRGTARARQIEMHVLPQSRVIDLIYKGNAKLLEVFEDDMAGQGNGIRSNTFVVKKLAKNR